MKSRTVISGCLAFVILVAATESAWAQPARPELIGFKSGDLELKGFVWKPSADGPFAALLWNHGSEKSPGSVDTVAPYFVSRGYVFFRAAPSRPGAFAGALHHGRAEYDGIEVERRARPSRD